MEDIEFSLDNKESDEQFDDELHDVAVMDKADENLFEELDNIELNEASNVTTAKKARVGGNIEVQDATAAKEARVEGILRLKMLL